MKQPNKKLSFSNLVIDKKQLKTLIVWAFRNYGIARAANMSDRLKDLGFYYATKAGISLSLEDLKIPPMKKILLQNTIDLIINVDYKYKRGEITAVERFQKVIDIWNNSSETLKEEVIKYFKYTDPLNAIYIMAFSGARGNISQVRQLVGMRGLMSDPQGQIIDLPISSNFREGLTVTDYFISSYGARKGLVDTALRTADSGYLTRRLVDVAQDVIIREIDCKTSKGILLENFFDNKKLLISLKQSLMGRVLAEDVFHPLNNRLIAHANEDVNDFIINSIINANISKVLIRSPITCNSKGSVCQKCYGWNLAHSKLVDLGEAVGIIAAQSIGEPGTQLTMRTFHTGGVFTGELADKVYAPCDGIIKHPDLSFLKLTRTSHGDKAYLIKKDCSIVLYGVNTSQQHIINLTTKSLLLVDDMTRVYYNQVIAEYPLRNRLITEKAKKFIVADIAGKIAFTNLKIEKDHNKQNSIKSAQSGGLIWVLSGQVHNIPDNSHLTVKKGSKIFPGIMLAITEIRSSYSGYIQISSNFSTQEVLVIIVSQTVLNAEIIMERYYDINSHILKTSNHEKFILKVKPKDKIVHQQIIAELLSDVYKTDTGGIIKFLDLPVSQNKDHANDNSYNVLGAGYILWISEETHEINKDVSLLLVKHGDFINAGTELIRNIISKNSGIVEIIEKDNIVKEIIIKPCTIYNVEDEMLLHQYTKRRGFLRPGENIVENIITNKLVYWEYLDIYERKVLLVRPVVVYSIPNKNYNFTYTQDSFRTDAIYLCIKRKIHFKDGARVKSVEGVDLIKTYLTVDILEELSGLTCFIDFIDYGSSLMKLKFIIADSIFIKDDFSLSYGVEVTYRNKLLVSDKMFVNKGDVIAQTELLSNVEGRIIDIQQSHKSSGRFLILTENDKYVCNISQCNNVKVHLYDWVYKNQEVAQNIYTSESGQVIYIDNEKIVLRIGRPYLISNGSIVHIDHNNLVQKGENIATLIFNRVKTGDIVQGLPRIEEILEARKKVDSNFNPHCLLENKFRYYINLGLSVYDATRISVQEIQLLLVKEVQLVYQAQGVDISDKHIEVIVKQMTAKVKIDNGGDTNYLPGEITDLQQIESINQTLFEINKQRALYHPILLGITKASLNTQSFISAASFQETTKVLTEAAISGKLDWLKGLKENVIIGRLIPAGTGFSNYNPNISTSNFNNERLYASDLNEILDSTVNNYLEDIILDDRSVRNATHSKFNNIDLQPSTDII